MSDALTLLRDTGSGPLYFLLMSIPRNLPLIVLVVSFLVMPTLLAGTMQPAEIVEDTIIFTFRPEAYKDVTADEGGKVSALSDIQIESVAVAGTFNNWDREAWKMKPTNDGGFELTKPAAEFRDYPDGEFKFVINEKYWAEPPLLVVTGEAGAFNFALPEPTRTYGEDIFAWAEPEITKLKADKDKVILSEYYIGRVASKLVVLTVTREEWDATPEWSPDSGEEPPLAVANAIKIARAWLKSKTQAEHAYRLESVELRHNAYLLLTNDSDAKSWHYLVRFAPQEPTSNAEYPEVMVLFGGAVAESFSLERGKSAKVGGNPIEALGRR